MKSIVANRLPEDTLDFHLLDPNKHSINVNNWNFPNRVTSSFDIAYNSQTLFLSFWANEYNIIGSHKEINAPVFEDSCVEFFIALEDGSYYNFEFNCIGTLLAGYGKNKHQRKSIDISLLNQILIKTSIGRNTIKVVNRELAWSLNIAIPIEVFQYSDLDSFFDKTVRCNFYKCGDKLPEPH